MDRNFDYKSEFLRALTVLVFVGMLVVQAGGSNSSYVFNDKVTPISLKPQRMIDPITGQLVGTGTSATDFGSYSEKGVVDFENMDPNSSLNDCNNLGVSFEIQNDTSPTVSTEQNGNHAVMGRASSGIIMKFDCPARWVKFSLKPLEGADQPIFVTLVGVNNRKIPWGARHPLADKSGFYEESFVQGPEIPGTVWMPIKNIEVSTPAGNFLLDNIEFSACPSWNRTVINPIGIRR